MWVWGPQWQKDCSVPCLPLTSAVPRPSSGPPLWTSDASAVPQSQCQGGNRRWLPSCAGPLIRGWPVHESSRECALGAMARPQLCKEKLLTGQEGLKHWGDPDVSNLLAPAWTWYRSKPVNVIPNSSSLIMDPSIDACWEMRRSRGRGCVRRNELVPKKLHWGSNLRESFATFHLWEWKHVKRGIYETFGDDHTQNTHQMLIYTHFKGNTQSGSHTHTQKHTQCCHWHFLQVKAGI